MCGLTRNYFSNGPSLCLTMPRDGPELYMWTNGFVTLCLCSCLLLERSRGTCPTSQGISHRKSLAHAIVQGEVRILTCNYRMSSFRPFFCPHCSGYCTFRVHHEKSLDPAFLKVSIDHLLLTLSLEK